MLSEYTLFFEVPTPELHKGHGPGVQVPGLHLLLRHEMDARSLYTLVFR